MLAALRLGLYELLFADGDADHAAVDQAVELAKGAAAAAHAAPASSTRSCAAPRASATSCSAALDDDSTRRGAALAHSVPVWLARAVVGASSAPSEPAR